MDTTQDPGQALLPPGLQDAQWTLWALHPKLAILTPKELAFCSEYLIDFNNQRASEAAGFSSANGGWELLQKQAIKEALAVIQQLRFDRNSVTAADVINELRRIAFSDVGSLFDERGDVRPISEWSEDLRRAVASIDVERSAKTGDAVAKIRLHDKLSALRILAQHLNILEPEQFKGEVVFKWDDSGG